MEGVEKMGLTRIRRLRFLISWLLKKPIFGGICKIYQYSAKYIK